MSSLSILVNPDSLGLTSCLNHAAIPIAETDEIENLVERLKIITSDRLNHLAANGLLLLKYGTSTRHGFEDDIYINPSWCLKLVRMRRNIFVYVLTPCNDPAGIHYGLGLRKLGVSTLDCGEGLESWLSYPYITKLFYLQEFNHIIKTPELMRAFNAYSKDFSIAEVKEWNEEYGWMLDKMSRVFKHYIKHHLVYYQNKLKGVSNGKN